MTALSENQSLSEMEPVMCLYETAQENGINAPPQLVRLQFPLGAESVVYLLPIRE